MAIVLATGSDYLHRTTGLVNCTTGPSTIIGWAKYGTPGAGYRTFWVQLDAAGTYNDWVGAFQHVAAADVYMEIGMGGVFVDAPTTIVAADTWFHWAIRKFSATDTRFYLNGSLIGTITTDTTAATLANEYLGNDTFSDGDLSLGLVRQWSVALTQPQIIAEMKSGTVVHTANLWADWPLIANVNDISGNGRNWTTVGSVSFAAGPQPTNYSAATATAITILPFTDTVTMAPPMDAWYLYTADSTQTVGMWGFGDLTDYKPLLDVFSPDSVTAYVPTTPFSGNVQNVPIQMPVVNGTDYYFKFYPNGTDPGTLAVSMLAAPAEAIVPESILVNDDSQYYSAAILSGVNGDNQHVLQFVPDIAVGEGGDVISDTGNILLENFPTDELILYNNDLSQILATLSFGGAGTEKMCIRANQVTQTFYAGQRRISGNPQINKITADGTMTTLATPTSTGLGALSVNDDETLIYLIGSNSGTTSVIKRWDVLGSVFLTDLVAAIAGYDIRDMLYMTDGTLLALYTKHLSPGDIYVKRYDTTGTLLNTYQLATNVQIPTVTPGYRLAFAIDDPVSFWVWYHVSDGAANQAGISTFRNLDVASGTVLSNIIYTEYQEGVYVPTASASPLARFGMSSSCPFIIMRGITPPTPSISTTEYLIRRERWFPVINQEQFRMFFSLLQIDLQAGNGLGSVPSTTQGFNPILELDWSDDGGWTWSNIHFIETGKVGQYTRRAIQRMLGQSRGRVYRIAVSDPVQWAIINGYMQVVLGTS